MNYLGVDYGEKRIGLALGDGEMKIASPFKVVGKVADVAREIVEESIDVVVVGLPYKSAGKNNDGDMVRRVEGFIKELKAKTDIKIIKIDERMTSKAADALGGDKKTKAPRDAVAAMLILQMYLDGLT